jgi:hypothetical protein
MTEIEGTPVEVADLAESCVRFVHEALGLTLDYTPETLPILDHYLREAGHGAKPEVVELLAPAAGAYFGEVVRRRVQAVRWHSPSGDYPGHRLELEPFFLWFNPMGVAMEVLRTAEAEGWSAHFQVLDDARELLAHALEAHEDVPPEDYYTLSMRLETLEQVVDLLAALEQKQPKPRLFGSEVYRAAAGDGQRDGLPS